MTTISQQLGRRAALLEKDASAKLRGLMRLFRLSGDVAPTWLMRLKNKNIGYVHTMPSQLTSPAGQPTALQVVDSHILEPWRGKRYGSKLYGEVFKDLKPGQKLYSDSMMNQNSMGAWDHHKRLADKLDQFSEYGGGAEVPWDISKSLNTMPDGWQGGPSSRWTRLKPGSGEIGIYSADRNPYAAHLSGKPAIEQFPPPGRKARDWIQDIMAEVQSAGKSGTHNID